MSAQEAERLARATLLRLTEPGDHRVGALVAELGGQALLEALLGQPALLSDDSDLAQRLAGIDPARDLDRAERQGIRFVIPGDAEWPGQLADLRGVTPLHFRAEPPLGLWVRGPVRLTDLDSSVAIVGAREATTYGTSVSGDLAGVVARAGHPVISGAAFGIDVAAHRGALGAGGTTVAVLACGVDRVYPATHRDLLTHLAEHGAVVSELPPGCAPLRIRFLARNRIIAALARGTVVVEAGLRSGALNTAHWAENLHRVVMAVPGPVTSVASVGVHQLIRNGGATVVTQGAEVLELVGDSGDHLLDVARAAPTPRDALTQRHREVLDAVPHTNPAVVTSIARTAGINVTEVRGALGALARQGFVEQLPSGWRLRRQASA